LLWIGFRARNYFGRSVVFESEKDLREARPAVSDRVDPDVVNRMPWKHRLGGPVVVGERYFREQFATPLDCVWDLIV
jgi:hypothetical protein